MPRTILVTKDSPILSHISTRVLNLYPNGATLVVTDAPVPETGDSGEINISPGLNLEVADEVVDKARKRFLLTRDVVAEGEIPAPETETSVSAYVEFIGQTDSRWLDKLRELGIMVLAYQPESSYLCYGPITVFQEAQKLVKTTSGENAIRSVTELTSDLKKKLPKVSENGEKVVIVVVITAEERDNIINNLKAVPGVELIEAAGNDILDANRLRLRARIRDGGVQANLLKLPRVLSVEAYHTPIPEDEVAGLIIAGLYDATNRPMGSYLHWLQDHGIDGQGVTIGIVDGGVDISHPAFSGRARDLTGGQKDWHATMVAGHAAGNYLTESDTNRFIYGLGTAPAAEIISQDKMQSSTFLCRQTVIEADSEGAIQNNSWGKETRNPMDYGSDEALYDSLVRNADPQGPKPLPLTICFSSGNSGSLGLTRPKAAKNLIVTGNSENFRPDVGHDGSNNISEVYSGAHGSSYGNCGDGRIRPHIVAPGEWTASANYDCHAGEDEFISPMLTWGGGSSGASPKTAGACALLTDWWRRNNNGKTPSPAMLRALIINGAEPILTGGAIPNNRQGWGRLNIQNILDPSVSRILADQTTFLSQPNEAREWRIRVVDPSRPVKITLAWTDPPGAIGSGSNPGASPVVNKLALRAEIGDHLFRGVHDRFRNGFSAADDAIEIEGAGATLTEGYDNVQNIFLSPVSVTSSIRVSVTAINVTTNCLNGMFDAPKQDFALVITNGQLDAGASPSNIIVAVDLGANGSAPASNSNGYWSDKPGNSDSHLLGGSPAEGTSSTPVSNGSPSTSSIGIPNPSTSTQEDDAWWADINLLSESRLETERRHLATPLTDDVEFALSLDAGFDLLGATGHRPDTVNLLGEGNSPSKRVAADLSDAITKLKDRLERQAVDPLALSFCAVLVIGAGTRVTVADVLGLRALGVVGRLFLLSDNPEVIAFLAQRIGNQLNIQYRLAKEPSELHDLTLDTLAEAGGLQPVVIAGPVTSTTPTAVIWAYRFGVVPDDREIVVHVRFPVLNGLKEVKFMRPGVPDVLWRPGGAWTEASLDVSVSFRDGLLQFRDAGSNRLTGTWAVEVTGMNTDQPLSLKVWALGGPWISVSKGVVIPAKESGRGNEQQMVQLSGESGVNFLQAFIPPPRVAAPLGTIVGDAPRDLVVQVRRSRLDSQGVGVAEDDRRPIPVPVLSQIMKVPTPSTIASVLDLPINVLGVDAKGNHFARCVRTNLVRLRGLLEWRAEMAATAPKVFYTRGQIVEAKLQKGLVVSLRLCRGNYSRVVNVTSHILGEELAALDSENLRGQMFTFGVQGRELRTIFRHFGVESVSSIPGDHGIEEAIRDVTRPRSESDNTDYPYATRFVRASSFRAGGDSRSINRVVIHITDGDSSIEGPISWFQNPASGVSAHYIVGQNGEVVQMVRDRDIAWHANNANGDSIGIEHCARAPGARNSSDPGLMPTALQYEASGVLVLWLCEQYSIPVDRDHILGHSEADARTTHSGCPNAVWDWDYYMNMLTTVTSLPPPGSETARRLRNRLYRSGDSNV